MRLDEFRFLASDAERVQRLAPLPKMRRITRAAASGKAVSALVTDDLLARLDATVVFLHGAGLNAHTFDPTVLALGEYAVSLDLPGHGRSDWRMDARYTPSALVDDVVHAITSLTTGRIHLVGQSLGGLTAAALIAPLRNRIETVTLIDVTPGISPADNVGDVSEFITGKRVFDSIDDMVARAIAFGLGDDERTLRRGVELNTRERSDGRYEWSHHFAHLEGFDTTDSTGTADSLAALWEPLASLEHRVALIRGARGIVSDRLQSEWRNRLTSAEIYTLDGGHNLQEHAPQTLAHTIQRIISV